MKCRQLPFSFVWMLALLLALLQAAQPARAALASVTGSLAGPPGATLQPVVVDTLADFEAADLLLTYDPAVLEFLGLQALLPDTSAVAGAPTGDGTRQSVQISYAIGSSPISGTDLQFLALHFALRSDAPFGPSSVLLDSLDPTMLDLSLRFDITVLPPPPALPTPGSASLALLALLALARVAAVRRRT